MKNMLIAVLITIIAMQSLAIYGLITQLGNCPDMDCVFTDTATIKGFNTVQTKTVIQVNDPVVKK